MFRQKSEQRIAIEYVSGKKLHKLYSISCIVMSCFSVVWLSENFSQFILETGKSELQHIF